MNGNYRHDYDDGGDLPDDPRETVEGGVGGYNYEFDDGYGGGNGGGYGGGANTSGRSYFSGGMSETSSVTSGWESREDSTRYSESTHGIEGASRTLEEINARLYASRYGGGVAGGGVGGSSSAGGGVNGSQTRFGGGGGGGGRSDIDVISEVLESLNEGDTGAEGTGGNSPSAAAQQRQHQQPQLVSQSSLGDTLSTGREEEDADERDLYAARFGRESGAYPSSYYRGDGGDGVGNNGGGGDMNAEDDNDDGRVPSLSSSLEFEEGPDGAGAVADASALAAAADGERRRRQRGQGVTFLGDDDVDDFRDEDNDASAGSNGWGDGFVVGAGSAAIGTAMAATAAAETPPHNTTSAAPARREEEQDAPFSPFADGDDDDEEEDDDSPSSSSGKEEEPESYPRENYRRGNGTMNREPSFDEEGYGDKLFDDVDLSQSQQERERQQRHPSYFGNGHGVADAVQAGAGVAVYEDPEKGLAAPTQNGGGNGGGNDDGPRADSKGSFNYVASYSGSDGTDIKEMGGKAYCGRYSGRCLLAVGLVILTIGGVGAVVAVLLTRNSEGGDPGTFPPAPATAVPTAAPTMTASPTTTESSASPTLTSAPSTLVSTSSPTATATGPPTSAPVTDPTPTTPSPTPSPTVPPTPSPTVTDEARLADVYDVLLPTSGGTALNDTSSPQYRAMEWMALNDGLRLDPSTQGEWMVQRHALATLYYATTGTTGGRRNLQDGWTDDAGFLSDSPECEWTSGVSFIGVTECSLDSSTGVNRAATIALRSNNLQGSLPPELAQLSGLRELDLGSNGLVGELPSELGDLPNLQRLKLDSNQIADRVPSRWRRLNTLVELDLSSNLLEESIIPAILSGWTSLSTLVLSDNRLTGALPSSIQNMQNLEVMKLNGNGFEGEIPASINFLSNLRTLDLSGNGFSGPVPEFRPQLGSLETAYLHGNNLTGAIDLCQVGPDDVEKDFASDCLPYDDGRPAEISECLCCTRCCNDVAGCVPV